jgi:alkylation response protein AidB-like acyl-CoA dehydrogenase
VTTDPAPSLTDAVARARRVADEVLFPAAQATDRAASVPRGNLDALRDAGLFGLQGPVDVPGGLGAGHAEARPVFEAVAGGCGATAFVWAQHHGAVRRLVGGDGPARDAWLPQLCDGSTLAGIGFAYLRRPGPPAVHARPHGEGWILDGTAPWITGWGAIGALVLMARADDGSVVTVAIGRPAAHPALRAGEPQALAVMGSTGTVALAVEGLEVAGRDVVGVQSPDAWSRRDRIGSALPPAAPLGIAARAVGLLADLPDADDAAAALAVELDERRATADDVAGRVLAAADASGHDLDAAIAVGAEERDRGLALARRATDALVAATGGRAMSLEEPAQRLSREATFYLIQAQTGALRAASLARAVRRA